MTNANELLVPVRVQALVIDDIVVNRKAILKKNEQKGVANDGKWSPLVHDYIQLTNALDPPGPRPFYGASRTAWGEPAASQLVLAADSPALPDMDDRGVYLRWLLPPGLRHSYKPGSLDFPALPDQWLIVRFCRRGGVPQTTRAWFLDGGLYVDSDDSDDEANMLVAAGGEYVAQRVGKVVPLEEFKPEEFGGERTTVTALGNSETGSPTFTANVAENRNVFSWHDSLEDLREPRATGKVPKDVSLTYLLLGWYHDAQNEPLASLPAQLRKEGAAGTPSALDVLKALGWQVGSEEEEKRTDFSGRRCLFHGMVAHVNYWNPETYKGTMLGYPGSPSVAGTLADDPPPFKVGVGNSAEDALVSLVSSEYSGDRKAPNLWKALEAVIYRRPESLLGSWDAAPRDQAVHQSWFNAHEAGFVWSIRPRPADEGTFNSDPDAPDTRPAPQPTRKQLDALKRLNEQQAEADAAARELFALEQDLYARWWKLSGKKRRDVIAPVADEVKDCEALAGRVKALRAERERLRGRVRAEQAFAATLPPELELRADPAPRFWTPADPFVVVKNCGEPTSHHFPHPLPCRLPEQVATSAEVTVAKEKRPFNSPAGAEPLDASIHKNFSARADTLTLLLKEASLVEQAVHDLVTRTLRTEQSLTTDDEWRTWTKRLVKALTAGDESKDRVRFGAPDAAGVRPNLLAALWVRQPWSPLFLDWKISWRPTANGGEGFGPAWRLNGYDYEPKDIRSLPTKGKSVSGRSLLSPVDGRIYDEPLKTLRELLKPVSAEDKKKGLDPAFPEAVTEILSRYQGIWDNKLKELAGAGMMGQALSGLHQALLGRDAALPRVEPDPARPWTPRGPKFRDADITPLLDKPEQAGAGGERLAPPSPTKLALDFTLLRAGAFRLEELWLVDDFGQWADLLGGTSAGGAAGQVFHPRARWHDDPSAVSMPPRVVQPARLNFRFTSADEREAGRDSDHALSPVRGWIFYNELDQALALCDREGRLAGELVVIAESRKFSVRWESAAGGNDLGVIRDDDLRDFAQWLVQTTPTPRPKLHELLDLLDGALERIRPAAARRDAVFSGRPLALVSAHVGLELFGKAWTDPQKTADDETPAGTGDAALDALSLPVMLGSEHDTEDGLVGYFKARDFSRIVPVRPPASAERAEYVADSVSDAVRVGFGSPKALTLLMDARGSVQAAVGILPAKTITLARAALDRRLARLEASFRVGPVLLQPDRLSMPTPAAERGRWHFRGPAAEDAPAPVVPPDTRYFADAPPVAAEGRLLLLTSEE